MANPDAEQTSQLLQTIEILEKLESLMDLAPSPEIEDILIEAWLKVSETFPEDFKDATRDDAGAMGLRRYMKVKAFFDNPSQNAISPTELAEYYQNHAPVDENSAKFFFLE
jgi:hypothetical protein